MADPRVLIDEADPPVVGRDLLLTDAPAHHLVRVLRVRPGDPVRVFDGSGSEWRTTVRGIEGRRLVLRVISEDHPPTECSISISLLQGLCRGERMDYVMQKATELGAAEIVAVSCERSNVRLDKKRAENRLAHWRGVSVSAAEQSGRVRIPTIDGPVDLKLAATAAADVRLVLAPGAEHRLTVRVGAAASPKSVAVMVGPEGGFTSAELDALVAAGWDAVSMGPRILRTETAGIVALAAIQACIGLI
jgi:16S rRNA (uracil1498-N3)-methyltransferase